MTKPDKNTPKDFLDWLNVRSLPDWTRSRGLGGLVATLLALLFITALVALVGILLHTIGQSMSPDSDGPNLGAGALIAALLGAPFVIWGTWLKHRTVTFQKEGHITDRINKAVEMLGAEKTVKKLKKDKSGSVEVTVPNIEVRIGAILSLERIAQDSTAYDKGRDHVRVMEILCAYVRENAPVANLEPTPTPFATAIPRIDIQWAIHVMGRRTMDQIAIESASKYRLDLRSCRLDGVDFSRGRFAGAKFWNARLEGANFSEADLTGTQFFSALLDYSNFWQTQLIGTRFDRAILGRMNFGGFTSATLRGVSIEGANASGLHFGSNADDLFGSSDTVVQFAYQEDKVIGLRAADENFLNKSLETGDRQLNSTGNLTVAQKRFLHWNPYTHNDLAAGEFRAAYRTRKSLIGWPFDD